MCTWQMCTHIDRSNALNLAISRLSPAQPRTSVYPSIRRGPNTIEAERESGRRVWITQGPLYPISLPYPRRRQCISRKVAKPKIFARCLFASYPSGSGSARLAKTGMGEMDEGHRGAVGTKPSLQQLSVRVAPGRVPVCAHACLRTTGAAAVALSLPSWPMIWPNKEEWCEFDLFCTWGSP